MCNDNEPLYTFLVVTYDGDNNIEEQEDFLTVWQEGAKGEHINVDSDIFENSYDCWFVHAYEDNENLQQLKEKYSENIIIPYSIEGNSGSEAVMGRLIKKISHTQEMFSYIVNHRNVLLNPQLLSEYDSIKRIDCEYLMELVKQGSSSSDTIALRKQAIEAIANGDTKKFTKLKNQIVESKDE